MNTLVIGGSGFVSGATSRLARDARHTVWGLSRGSKPLPEGVHAIVADRKDRDAFARAVAAVDVHFDLVIDCIGYEPDDARQDLDVFTGRADHLVFISTDFVLSPDRKPWRVDETYDRFATADYGFRKRQCEEMLLAQSDLPTTVLRPCHIYGPGSKLGPLPLHGRDDGLIEHLRAKRPVRLIGGGHFLQQPVYFEDVARMALSCAGNARTIGQIYFAAGPGIAASWVFYDLLAQMLGVELQVEEVPIASFLAEHPDRSAFCCHRVYDPAKAREHGLALPDTPLAEGLRKHLDALL